VTSTYIDHYIAKAQPVHRYLIKKMRTYGKPLHRYHIKKTTVVRDEPGTAHHTHLWAKKELIIGAEAPIIFTVKITEILIKRNTGTFTPAVSSH
jgi:hypothetical protein